MILGLIAVNGFFAGAEIAIVAMRKTRMTQLADRGSGSAAAVLALRREPERFLATVQVGITVVGASAAAFGGSSLGADLARVFADLKFVGRFAHELALALVIAGVSYLSIVLGELVPKSLALRNAERFALMVGKPVALLAWMARPLVWLLTASSNLVLKPFGDQTNFTEARHSGEELQQLVEEASQAGTVNAEAGEIAARALDLPALDAEDVMVARNRVVGLRRDAPSEEIRRILLEHTHSRLPVYEGHADRVVGYVAVKDLLAMAWGERLIVLEDVIRPAHFVPAAMSAVALMRDMQRRHNPFAVVVDEHGGMKGIVTLEDLLEELVGDIFSERHDYGSLPNFTHESTGSVLASGATPLRELQRELDLEFPASEGVHTIAGLCLKLAGRIPVSGESFQVGDVTISIVDASPRRVRTVRLTRAGGARPA